MSTIKRFSYVLSFTLFAFVLTARAQTPSIEVTADDEQVEFAAQGKTLKLYVEVFAPSGELVFETEDAGSQSVRWTMVNQRGDRVPDGVYLATITVTDYSGKRRKRIEQVTVSSESQRVSAPGAEASAPQEALSSTTGSGTAGKIAKWTTPTNLGNSALTESAGKIGINLATPLATLHVNNPPPPALASNGTAATNLLQTGGGKGGNTTGTTGQIAGAGAGIALYAGIGGDAPAGSKRGNGGNIVLQPGSAGGGAGTAGLNGNVFIAPSGVGNLGVGTSTAPSRLTVSGMIQTTGAGSGIKFADGSVQSKATNITGAGTANQLAKFTGPNSFGNSIITEAASGRIGIGTTNPQFKLHVEGGSLGVLNPTGNFALYGNSPNGVGVTGISSTDVGVLGDSNTQTGVLGESTTSNGVKGQSSSGIGVAGRSNESSGVSGTSFNGYGVYGHSSNNFAGYFEGKAKVTGNFELGGNQSFGAQTRQMLNLYNTTYGIGVQSSVLYFRTDDNFAWFQDGVHANEPFEPGAGGAELMRLDESGNLTVRGTFSPNSDRNIKANFDGVNPRSVLIRLATIPIQTWSYKSDNGAVRHIGPMAQDFRAAFNLGADDLHISTVDADGVALASIQGLYQMMLEKDRELEQLRARVTQLERTSKQRQQRRRHARR